MARFEWTEEAQLSFEALKKALVEATSLAFPVPQEHCILDTDASDVAVGAVLSQRIDGIERPIAFFSRVMNETQRRYCTTRRELLAVICAILTEERFAGLRGEQPTDLNVTDQTTAYANYAEHPFERHPYQTTYSLASHQTNEQPDTVPRDSWFPGSVALGRRRETSVLQSYSQSRVLSQDLQPGTL